MKIIPQSKKHALIVDDEIDICYLLDGILRKKSFHPKFVTCLSAAETSLQKEIPSVIFLDNHLPDGLGIEFIVHVKKHYPSVKIAMITAIDSSADRNRAYESGADYFITKPFNMKVIDDVIKDVK